MRLRTERRAPRRFDDGVEEVRKRSQKAKTVKSTIVSSNFFARRYSVRGSFAKDISYTPLAICPKVSAAPLKRYIQKYREHSMKDEEYRKFISSSLYERIQKAYNKIVRLGHDDHLACRIKVSRIAGKGLGIRACAPICKGSVIGFYGGELVSIYGKKKEQYYDNHYLFGLPDSNWNINGEKKRSLVCMINHGEDPNVESFFIEQGLAVPQVVYLANRNIKEGEEITIDYDAGKDEKDPKFFACLGVSAKA